MAVGIRIVDGALGTFVDTRSGLVGVFERRGIHYGWVVAFVSFLTLITAAGFRLSLIHI